MDEKMETKIFLNESEMPGDWHNILPEDKNAADTATAQPMQQPPHPPPDTSSTEPGE